MLSSRPNRSTFDIEGHAFFVTFSCYHGAPLLERDRCKQIVLGNLEQLSRNYHVGVVAYVIMHDHVHILIRPETEGTLSKFMQQWKRLTSFAISEFLELKTAPDKTPFGNRVRDENGAIHVWQKRFYPVNIFTPQKALEKIEYIHNNPVRAGLVDDLCEWPWSSAKYFLKGVSVPLTLVPYDGPINFSVLFRGE